jgi:hypothetical protein
MEDGRWKMEENSAQAANLDKYCHKNKSKEVSSWQKEWKFTNVMYVET